MERFRGGLVFKDHRLSYHSTLGSRVIKKNKTKRPFVLTSFLSLGSLSLRSRQFVPYTWTVNLMIVGQRGRGILLVNFDSNSLNIVNADGNQIAVPLSSKDGTYKTVKARFQPCLGGKRRSSVCLRSPILCAWAVFSSYTSVLGDI